MPRIHEKRVIDTKQIVSDVIKYTLLTIGALILFFPFLWMLTTSLKTLSEAISTPPVWLPRAPQWVNYAVVWNMKPFMRYIMNTVICCICHVAGVVVFSVLVGSMLAYVLNRFRFPGNGLIRNLFLFATLIPGIAMQVTIYQIMASLKLVNSLLGYIILQCGTDVISIYIFLQYFENLSVSLDESAILDGCTYFGVFFKILFPLLRPAIVTVMILKGIGVYNEYYAANLYLQDKTRFVTVSTALYTFTGPFGNAYNLICAGVILTLVPMLVIFIACQQQIYSGLAAGAVKG